MVKHEIRQTKEVFVAYPYTLFKKSEYRRVYNNAGREYGVKFIFADERITDMHILDTIRRYITSLADFSIFDISGWNSNVTLELGVAYGAGANCYICYNPSHNAHNEVPSNIRGIDRIQYQDFSELESRLTVLLDQWYPNQGTASVASHEADMRAEVLSILQRNTGGLRAVDIADMLNCRRQMARVLIESLVKDKKVKHTGATRARRYFLK